MEYGPKHVSVPTRLMSTRLSFSCMAPANRHQCQLQIFGSQSPHTISSLLKRNFLNGKSLPKQVSLSIIIRAKTYCTSVHTYLLHLGSNQRHRQAPPWKILRTLAALRHYSLEIKINNPSTLCIRPSVRSTLVQEIQGGEHHGGYGVSYPHHFLHVFYANSYIKFP